MSDPGKRDHFRLGFLTAVEVPEKGFVGGLLVTNRFGRPLEFQCTAPVKANRTQEILYGATLKPYLLAELIGRTLVDKVAVKPHVVLTEHAELLDLREHVGIPVACLGGAPGARTMKLGNQQLTFHLDHSGDQSEIERHASDVPPEADLKEPFDRVREALNETLKTVKT
jgi:hypothetical protein